MQYCGEIIKILTYEWEKTGELGLIETGRGDSMDVRRFTMEVFDERFWFFVNPKRKTSIVKRLTFTVIKSLLPFCITTLRCKCGHIYLGASRHLKFYRVCC